MSVAELSSVRLAETRAAPCVTSTCRSPVLDVTMFADRLRNWRQLRTASAFPDEPPRCATAQPPPIAASTAQSTKASFTAVVSADQPHEIDIDAPVERVWRIHIDVARWPEWQAEITDARIDGPFEPDTAFDWTSYGFSVTSTIYEVEENVRVLWGGTAGGITGIHKWLPSATPIGTHVETNESFAGDPVDADATSMQSMLDASLEAWLAHLKAAAESEQ